MSIMVSAAATPRLPLEFSVLGTFQARIDGEWCAPPTRQVAKVATVLAGWPGAPVERERIVAAVWGERPPATVTNTLQVHVSHLRRMIGRDAVRSSATGYQLDVSPEAVDAEQFLDAVHEAARMRRRQHFGRAAEILDAALGLWRGTPFTDIADPDLEARRARLTELRDQAREDLLECRLELARDGYDLAEVVADARELVSRSPDREKGHVLLVRSLAAADRPGEACSAFEAAQDRIRGDMGLDPSRQLVETHARALNHDPAIYPRAMRSITLAPKVRGVTDAHRATAKRVREAVVDLDASLVTVLCPRGADQRRLASSIAEALLPDLMTGVIAVEAARSPQPRAADAVDAAVNEATEGDEATLAGLPDREQLGVVAMTTDGSLATPLADLVGEWVQAPRLVVISPESLDRETEVVIAHGEYDVTAPPAPRGARA